MEKEEGGEEIGGEKMAEAWRWSSYTTTQVV